MSKQPSSVVVTPATATVGVGSSITIAASCTDAEGRPCKDVDVTFSSGDETLATVDNKGVVTGVKAGAVTITAHHEGSYSADCVVTVP